MIHANMCTDCLIGNLNTTLFEEQKIELFKDAYFDGKSIDFASPTYLMSLSHLRSSGSEGKQKVIVYRGDAIVYLSVFTLY